MKRKGNNSDNKEKRLMTLEKILEEFDKEDKKASVKELLSELRKRKFIITRSTLYEDMTQLAINDPFVKDLASKSYSKIIHDCFDSIEFVERKAREILEKKWTRSKIVKKKDSDGLDLTEIHTTEELAEPHLKAMQEIRECAVSKVKLLGGDVIKVSAKKWSLQRQKDIQTIAELKLENRELREKSTLR